MTATDGASFALNRDACQPGLRISRDGSRATQVLPSLAAWFGVGGTPPVRVGAFKGDYALRANDHQLGVGLMVDPPDWGFFGYLGSGANA